MDIYENLKKCDIELPEKLNAAGLYKPVNQTGKDVYKRQAWSNSANPAAALVLAS